MYISRQSYLVQQALHDSVVAVVKEGCLESDETRKRGFTLFQKSMEAADGVHCLQLSPTQSTLGLQLHHLQALDQLQGSKDKVLQLDLWLQQHGVERDTNEAVSMSTPSHFINTI